MLIGPCSHTRRSIISIGNGDLGMYPFLKLASGMLLDVLRLFGQFVGKVTGGRKVLGTTKIAHSLMSGESAQQSILHYNQRTSPSGGTCLILLAAANYSLT